MIALRARYGRPWGTWHIVSDVDRVAAVARGQEPIARHLVGAEATTVSVDERLEHASRMMVEHGVSHLVVLHAASGHPVGIISALDIATACGTPRNRDERARPDL